MIINISKDNQYHTQRNNQFYPQGTCNTTASINALLASGISFDYPHDMQPEDYLTQILESPEAWKKLQKEYPQLITQGYHPRHVHKILEWAINDKLVKRKVVRFTTNASIHDILFHVYKHGAVNVNGSFTEFGHIVTVMGYSTKQNNTITKPYDIQLDKIEYIIIDDPYGNYFKQYHDYHGNDIQFPLQVFNTLTKEYDNLNKKLAHFFYPEGIA